MTDLVVTRMAEEAPLETYDALREFFSEAAESAVARRTRAPSP